MLPRTMVWLTRPGNVTPSKGDQPARLLIPERRTVKLSFFRTVSDPTKPGSTRP